MAGLQRLARLQRFGELEHESALKSLRNEAASHLGCQETALRASRGSQVTDCRSSLRPATERPRSKLDTTYAWRSSSPASTRDHTTCQSTGQTPIERLRVEEMETALAEASDTHDAVFEWLDELFMDVLQKAGGDIESLEALEETSLD